MDAAVADEAAGITRASLLEWLTDEGRFSDEWRHEVEALVARARAARRG